MKEITEIYDEITTLLVDTKLDEEQLQVRCDKQSEYLSEAEDKILYLNSLIEEKVEEIKKDKVETTNYSIKLHLSNLNYLKLKFLVFQTIIQTLLISPSSKLLLKTQWLLWETLHQNKKLYI